MLDRWQPWADELAQREVEGLRRRRHVVTRLPQGRCERNGRTLLNLSGNDYLGLATDPRLAEAVCRVANIAGVGAGASPLVSGRSPWHVEAEEALARFEGTDAAILFPSGYAANLGALSALLRPGDVALCDRLNHACLIDGVRLSGATLRVYRSDDLATLRRELAGASGSGRRWIVTDGVFGMDGHFAPLAELCNLADEFDARVVVDEAHGTGVFGERGRGACEEAGVEDRVALRIGTLSKAVGCQGGFVAGPHTLIDWLWNSARTQMFSTAVASPMCGAITQAVAILEAEPERRARVRAVARALRERFRARGLEVPGVADCPIIPVIVGDPIRTMDVAQRLEASGYLVGAIRPPTVPRGTSRLRLSLSADHTETDLAPLAEILHSALRP